MMLIDSHCHLDRLDLTAHEGSLDKALDAARARGVGKFLCIGVDAANAPVVKGLAEQYGDVWCSVGIHPLDLSRNDPAGLDWLLTELNHPRSEEHSSELSHVKISYAVFCLKKKK